MNTQDDITETKELSLTTVEVDGMRPAIKTGYEWLSDMIHVRNSQASYKPNLSPVTNRAMFIINALNEIGVQYEVDIFDEAGYDLYDYHRPKLVNIVVKFASRSGQPAIVFCAHHDIVNSNSQNCQDNSASVCNLLHLIAKLKEQAYGENNNMIAQRPVIFVFTDKEERGGIGARRMSGRLLRGDFGNFEYVINLELTGLGDAFWMDRLNAQSRTTNKTKTPVMLKCDEVLGENTYYEVSTPFSDAIIFRRCGIDAICVGILPDEQLSRMNWPPTWGLCHSETDTIDKCNEEDMSNFTDALEKFVIGNLN